MAALILWSVVLMASFLQWKRFPCEQWTMYRNEWLSKKSRYLEYWLHLQLFDTTTPSWRMSRFTCNILFWLILINNAFELLPTHPIPQSIIEIIIIFLGVLFTQISVSWSTLKMAPCMIRFVNIKLKAHTWTKKQFFNLLLKWSSQCCSCTRRIFCIEISNRRIYSWQRRILWN